MNDSIIQIMLDLQNMNGLTTVRLKKGDTARKIIITLSDGGFPYEIGNVAYAVLTGRKPDGCPLFNHCDLDGNKIIYDVTPQTVAAVGKMRCNVRLYGPENEVLTSAWFQMVVDDDLCDDEVVESSPEFTALTKLMSEVVKITKEEGAILMLHGATEQTLLEIRDMLGGINTSVTGMLRDPGDWGEVATAVRAGKQSLNFSTGDQLVPIWTEDAEYENPFDVVQVECSPELRSGEIVHGMMIQQHYATTRGCPFDAQEALYDAVDGLPAGTYHFAVAGDTWLTSENGKVLQFTLTKPIPAGGQLVYANTDGYNQVIAGQKINTYAAPDNFTAIESVVLSEGDGGTDLGTTDGNGDLNHHQRAFRGCGRWKTSMLRQYLNSDKPAGQWWTKQDKWDRATTFINTCPGYMAGFDPAFLAAIKRVKVDTARDTVAYDGGTDTTYDYFFPVSLEQLNAAPQAAGIEGQPTAYWEDVASADTTGKLDTSGRFKQYETYPDLIHYGLNAKTTARSCWLRSASRGTSCHAWNVYSSGLVNGPSALNGYFCAPACVIC